MKRVPLAVLALVMSAAACQEFATSPQTSAEATVRATLSNPPPPPIDTGASGSFTPTAVTAPINPSINAARFGVVGASSVFFTVPVRYFFNPPENSGYLHFRNDLNSNASGGSIKDQKGVLSGNGLLTLQLANGVLSIDLSSVQQPPSFLGCGVIVPQVAGPPPPASGGVCFYLFFSSATFTPTGGNPIQGTVNLSPSAFFR